MHIQNKKDQNNFFFIFVGRTRIDIAPKYSHSK